VGKFGRLLGFREDEGGGNVEKNVSAWLETRNSKYKMRKGLGGRVGCESGREWGVNRAADGRHCGFEMSESMKKRARETFAFRVRKKEGRGGA